MPDIRPRDPLTPYFLFLREKRYLIAQSYPDIPVESMSATIGKVWRNMPESDKKGYFDEYERACRIYSQKLTQYYSLHPREVEEKQKIKRQIEDKIKKERRRGADEPEGKGKRARKEDDEGKKPRKKKKADDKGDKGDKGE